MARIVDNPIGNKEQNLQDPCKNFWGIHPQFFSQNFLTAWQIYLVRSSAIGPFWYSIPEHLKDKIIYQASEPNFAVNQGYSLTPLFANQISNYVGQPLFAVLANTTEAAQEIAQSIPVIYQEIENKPQASTEQFSISDILYKREEGPRAFDEISAQDEQTLSQASYVIPTQKMIPSFCGAYAFYGTDNLLHIYVTTELPLHVQKHVAQCLQIPEDQFIIHPMTQGSVVNYLGMEPTFWACYVAIATKQTKKPCKLCLSQEEAYSHLPLSPTGCVETKLVFNAQKKLLACGLDVVLDFGYITSVAEPFITQILDIWQSVYRLPQFSIRIRVVKTHKKPCCMSLCQARILAKFVLEILFQQLTEVQCNAPCDIRLNFLNQTDDFLPTKMAELINYSKKKIDFDRKNFAYAMETKKNLFSLFDKENTIYLPIRGMGVACVIGSNAVSTCYVTKTTDTLMHFSTQRSLMTCMSEVVIDPIDFSIRFSQLQLTLFCGKIQNEQNLRAYIASILNSVLQGLYRNPNDNLHLWSLPIRLWPCIHFDILEDKNPNAVPLSIAGLVESCVPASYLAAVSQALNMPIYTFPIVAETIFHKVKAQHEVLL